MHPIRIVDKYIYENEDLDHTRTVGRYWPTEASLVVDGSPVGMCMRQSFYRYTDTESTDYPSVSRLRRMQWGNLVEANERVYLRKSGLLYGENISVDVKYNDIVIAGRLDAVINKDNPTIIEIKTGYGDNFYHHVLSPETGKPYSAHVLQGLLYLYMYSDAKELVFLYFDRGTANRREHWLSLNRFLAVINNNQEDSYNVLGILQRFELLHKHIITKKLPPRDYAPTYTGHSILSHVSKRRVSSKTLRDFKSGQEVGDWQCKECPFRSRCIDEE